MTDSPRKKSKRVAFITGAAGGIGAETARVFAAQNYDLALLDCDGDGLENLQNRLGDDARVLPLRGDLSDLEWCERAVETAAQTFGQIDVLVNLAAWREITTMTQISMESWQRTLDICLTAPAFLARWCATHMTAGSAIINISSLNARQSAGLAPAYVAAKGGLESLTHELAALYGPRGVRVVGLALGAIDTALSGDYAKANEEDALRTFAENMIPLRRYGTASEAARAIAWLASPEASYLTGTTIEMNGGWAHHHLPHDLKHEQFPGEFS
jgi:3-oxoacyl-[acyl-carrier protein] reductase